MTLSKSTPFHQDLNQRSKQSKILASKISSIDSSNCIIEENSEEYDKAPISIISINKPKSSGLRRAGFKRMNTQNPDKFSHKKLDYMETDDDLIRLMNY